MAWGSLTLLLIGFCDISMQNAAEALFIKRVGVEYMPLAFLASSLVLVFTTSFLGWYLIKNWRPKLMSAILVLLSILIVPLWLLVKFEISFSVVILTVLFEQIKALSLLVFWVSMGKMLTARQAKRLFAPLLAGVTAGSIIGSFLSAPLSHQIGIEGLIGFSAIVLLFSSVFAFVLESKGLSRLERGLQEKNLPTSNLKEKTPQKEKIDTDFTSLKNLWKKSQLFRLLCVATVCSGILMPMLYFEFSYVADLATKGSGGEQKLLTLYSQLRGWLYLSILVIQVSFASKIYRVIGVPLAVALSPLIYLFGFTGLSLYMTVTTGIVAIASAQMQDKAVYTPGVRILYNLFSEDFKSTAIALLDGPIMRTGCAIGSVAVFAIVTLANATVVGYFAIPITIVWLLVSIVLWKKYPTILLKASTENYHIKEKYEGVEELFDPGTLKSLSAKLNHPDASVREAANSLLSDAPTKEAISIFSEALRDSDDNSRKSILVSLDQILAPTVSSQIKDEKAAKIIEQLLDENKFESEEEKAMAISAYGSLRNKRANLTEAGRVLEKYKSNQSIALKLAALDALDELDFESKDTHNMLLEATKEKNQTALSCIVRILRDHLIDTKSSAPEIFELLINLSDTPEVRVDSTTAIAQVTSINTVDIAQVKNKMLSLRQDENSGTRIAIINYIGHLKLSDQAPWLVSRLISDDEQESIAARDTLLLLGESATNALMIEHRFGKRSQKNEIVSIFHELKVKPESLNLLYKKEIELLQRSVLNLYVMQSNKSSYSSVLIKRMEERIEEGVHAALLILTAIHDDHRIAELADHLITTKEIKQKALLVEALETLLNSEEKKRLLPIIEKQSLETLAKSFKKEHGLDLPDFNQVTNENLNSEDELTRVISTASVPDDLSGSKRTLVDTERLKPSINPVEAAMAISNFSLFEDLSTRQLMDLAKACHDEIHLKNSTIVKEGEEDMSIFLILSGQVEIIKGGTSLTTLKAGDFFGEMAIFENEKRSASVVAKKDSRTLRLSGEDLIDLIEEQPTIAYSISHYLSKRVLKLNNKLEEYETEKTHGGIKAAL